MLVLEIWVCQIFIVILCEASQELKDSVVDLFKEMWITY